jgi:hypothetical protein
VAGIARKAKAITAQNTFLQNTLFAGHLLCVVTLLKLFLFARLADLQRLPLPITTP